MEKKVARTVRCLLVGAMLLGWLAGFNREGVSRGRGSTGSNQQSTATNTSPVKRDSLLNGLQLIVGERNGYGKVTVHLRINSGAMFDLATKGGLADITAGMLLRGGAGMGAKGISDLTSQLSLTINVTVGWDSTDIVIGGSSSDFDAIVDLLGKLILKPGFDQKELDSLKAQRVGEMLSEKVSGAQAARNDAMWTLFGNYPFGHPEIGTTDSIGKITRDDVALYYSRFYIPNNAELLINGDVATEEVTRIARTRLGVWGKGDIVPPTFVPPVALTGHKTVIIDSASSEGTAVLAQIGASRRAEDYFADMIVAKLISDVAAKAGSPLGARYTSTLDARYLPGPLVIEVDAPVGNLQPACQAVINSMISVLQGNVSEEEVSRVKGDIITSFESTISTEVGNAKILLDIEQYGLGRDYVINFADRVNAVSMDEITAAARKHLSPGALAIAAVGPASQLQPAFAKFGAVSVSK